MVVVTNVYAAPRAYVLTVHLLAWTHYSVRDVPHFCGRTLSSPCPPGCGVKPHVITSATRAVSADLRKNTKKQHKKSQKQRQEVP